MNQKLTAFDFQLLEVVLEGESKAQWDWYLIGRYVVYEGAEGERHMMQAMKELEGLGLLKQVMEEGHKYPDWRITDKGKKALEDR